MAITDIEALWEEELNFEHWWKELLGGQNPHEDGFNAEKALEKVPRTDIVAARVIKEKIGANLTYIPDTDAWFAWNGIIHEPYYDPTLVHNVIKRFWDNLVIAIRHISVYYESQMAPLRGSDDPAHKRTIKAFESKVKELTQFKYYRDGLGSTRGMSSLTKMLQSEFHQDMEYFESDSRWLVTKNAVLDTQDLTPEMYARAVLHDSSRPVSKYLDVNYNPDAVRRVEDSHFMKFLRSSVRDGDPEIIDYLQRVVGAAFMGENKLRTIINFVGPPSSGKSLFLETFFKLGQKGAGYCAMPDSRAITKVTGQNWEQTQFRGRRMIGISEPSSREEIDDDFLKRFTGDVWLETRNLREKSSGWAPQGVIFISSNDYLRINTRDKAIVDRISIVEFPYEFVENPDPDDPMQKKRDSTLTEILQHNDEKEAILMWVVEGMRKFNQSGKALVVPSAIRETSKNVVSNGSTAMRWVNDLRQSGDISIQTSDQNYHYVSVEEAWFAFSSWAVRNGERTKLSRRYFEEDIGKWYETVNHGFNKHFSGLMWTDKYRSKLNTASPSEMNVDGNY